MDIRNTPFFSIVIPCYNAQAYVMNSYLCLKNQTYSDFEIIFVDDFSKDNTKALLEEITKNDNRVSILAHSENKKQSEARNTGIKNANGEYILFLDVDDDYESNLLESIKNAIDNYSPDLIIYSLYEEYTGKDSYSTIHKRPEGLYNNKSSMGKEIALLEKETMLGYPWNKAYKLSIIKDNKISFEVVDHIEDILFNLSYIKKINSFYVISAPLYHYKNAGTIGATARVLPNYFELQKRRVREFIDLEKAMEADEKEFYPVAAGVYFRSFISFIERNITEDKEKLSKSIYDELESDLFNTLRDYLKLSRITKPLYMPLIEKNVNKAIVRVKLVRFVKNNFSGLYQRLKQNR